jgi:hypothetical protein
MGLTLDLPPPLEEVLTREAERERVSPAEHASLLLSLATALREKGPETPFRVAVRTFLSAHAVDPDQFGVAMEGLLGICSDQPNPAVPIGASLELRWSVASAAHHGTESSILQSWRNSVVHLPTTEEMIPSSGRTRRRPSARGKYAHLGLSSEEFAREKQEEIAREERGWQ